MNNKLNSLLSLIAIACAVGVPLSLTIAHELPVQASLTAPASYDIGFNGVAYTGVNGASPTSVALFERTADGIYYDYYHRFRDTRLNPNHTNPPGSGMHSAPALYDLPLGLDITMDFQRSNTNWTIATPYNGYYNTDTKIGSDNTVGTISNKFYLKFDNQTNKDYSLFLDFSSSGNATTTQIKVDDSFYISNRGSSVFSITETNHLVQLYLPSYTYIEIYAVGASTARYFDAWYLKDLGIDDAWQEGYDYADQGPLLINAFESLIGIFVNFTFIIFSLEMFGVSILTIVGVLFGVVAIVWILKTIRG